MLEEIRLQRIVLCESTGFYVFLKYVYICMHVCMYINIADLDHKNLLDYLI